MTLKLVILICAFIFTAMLSAEVFEDDADDGPLSNNCLRCICKALGCPRMTTCKDACGPFYITYGYWQDAFYREDNEQEEFRKCTLNAWCAARTVQANMKRFLPKCVRDSESRDVCETAMALHKYGWHNCTMPLPEATRKSMASCMDRYTRNWLNA